MTTEPSFLQQSLTRLMQAPSWVEAQYLIKTHPELLSDEADALLRETIEHFQMEENNQAVTLLIQYRTLLQRCREIGTDAAFQDKLKAFADQQSNDTKFDIPDEVRSLIEELNYLTRITDMPKRVEMCGLALHLVSRDENPHLWATLQGDLGNSLVQTPQGEKAENIETAIDAYKQALHVRTRNAMPEKWATTMMNLANAYYKRIRGDKAENIESAIDGYEQALQVISPQVMPNEWVKTLINMATAYSDRIRGDKIQNIEATIGYLQQALRVATRQAMPVEWAYAMMNLGNAYYVRTCGERAENLERAIDYYEQALQVRTRNAMPLEWATTMMELANTYAMRVHGDKAENMETAINAYKQALQVRTRNAMPIEWAMTMNVLAGAYAFRIRGNKAENMELAIDAYKQALDVITRQAMSVEWAMTLNILAAVYTNRISGDKAENMELAIDACQQALEVITRQAMPVEWAMIMSNQAAAYTFRINGDKAKNIELAIDACRQALQVNTRSARPDNWATTITNLANAYSKRIRGDKAENIEMAIDYYQQALQIVSAETMPDEWADAMTNLANTYSKRIRGDKVDNIESAIDCYQKALEVQTRQAMPVKWALIMNNFATAYANRIRGDKAENIEVAIGALKQVLQVRTRQIMPVDWATTMNNLAVAYAKRIRGDKATNNEETICYCQQALQVTSRQAMPLEWAETMMNLADAYANRIWGNKAENIKVAIDAYQKTLEVFTDEALPENHRDIQRKLGDAFFAVKSWKEAVSAYRQALATGEQLYAAAPTPEARWGELRATRNVPTRLAVALYQQSPQDQLALHETVVAVERSRARWLSESVALEQEQPSGVDNDLWHSFIEARQQVQELLTESRLPDATRDKRPFTLLSSLLNDIRDQLQVIISAIRAVSPEFMPELTFDQIQASGADGPLVYLFSTDVGGLALIVYTNKVQAVWLDQLTDDTVREWLIGANSPAQLSGWLGAYQTWLIKRTTQAQQAWFVVIDNVMQQIWSQVMEPVAAALHEQVHIVPSSTPEVILIPTGLLALLPLHAAWHPDPASPTGRRYFLDEFTVSYAPSALALRHACAAATTQPTQRLLAVAEPKPVRSQPLPNAQAEIDAITALFDTSVVLRHEEATHQAIARALPTADIVHFACHGANDWANPLESGLCMAHDQLLKVRDLLEMKDAAGRLAILSACETGIVGTQLPDEVVALPSALLQAGFGGVVASLWSVADMSTAMLMSRFYEYWRNEGLAPVHALRAAQRWLRDTSNSEKAAYFRQFSPELSGAFVSSMHMPETVAIAFYSEAMSRDMEQKDFAHPFWWAAFYLTGV